MHKIQWICACENNFPPLRDLISPSCHTCAAWTPDWGRRKLSWSHTGTSRLRGMWEHPDSRRTTIEEGLARNSFQCAEEWGGREESRRLRRRTARWDKDSHFKKKRLGDRKPFIARNTRHFALLINESKVSSIPSNNSHFYLTKLTGKEGSKRPHSIKTCSSTSKCSVSSSKASHYVLSMLYLASYKSWLERCTRWWQSTQPILSPSQPEWIAKWTQTGVKRLEYSACRWNSGKVQITPFLSFT